MQTRPTGTRRSEPGAWKARAACTGLTDGEMYPTDHQGEQDRAKAVCDRCSVRLECLTHALQQNERWGTWGGMSETARQRLRSYIRDHPGVEISVALEALEIDWSPNKLPQADPLTQPERYVDEFERFLVRFSQAS